jgi:hypothetical protein
VERHRLIFWHGATISNTPLATTACRGTGCP